MNRSNVRESFSKRPCDWPPISAPCTLDQTCAGDTELRRRVDTLLGAFERAGGFLKEPAMPTPARKVAVSLPPTEKPGDRIGRYKLLEQIGEGGCGVVYVAEQEEPVRRRVALKVIKLGMDTNPALLFGPRPFTRRSLRD